MDPAWCALAAHSMLIVGSEEPPMSMLDLFAWIVLIVLALCTVAVIIFLAMLPGMIAKSRKHPWAKAITVAGWVTLFLGFALWPVVLIWAYVDIPRGAPQEAAQ